MKTNKIAFVVDGYFGLTIYKNIKSAYGKAINFEGLVDSACSALESVINEKCISPANLRHYYMGTDIERIDAERNEYEDSLKLSRFGARGRPLQNGREKGIDTMLYSDIMAEANSCSFDYLILLAGDLDHITLVQDLKSMGIKTVLFYGEIITNGVKTTGYSYELKNSCFSSVNLFELLDNEDIFQSANGTTNLMTSFMKKTNPSLGSRMVLKSNSSSVPTIANTVDSSLEDVISSVKQVISEKEQSQGRKLAFALQAQVGLQLKKNGINLPMPLGNFLKSYPNVFRTGTHPATQALTVSIQQDSNGNPIF